MQILLFAVFFTYSTVPGGGSTPLPRWIHHPRTARPTPRQRHSLFWPPAL